MCCCLSTSSVCGGGSGVEVHLGARHFLCWINFLTEWIVSSVNTCMYMYTNYKLLLCITVGVFVMDIYLCTLYMYM